jgi:type IV secretory pathway TrbD component
MTKQTQGLLLASTTALFWGVLAIALKVGLQSWIQLPLFGSALALPLPFSF